MAPLPYRLCASILVVRTTEDGKDHEFLLVHKDRKKDAWQLPQGGIEKGETPEQAASRELMEETGLKIPPDTLQKTSLSFEYDYPRSFVRAKHPPYRGQRIVFLVASVDRAANVQIDQDEIENFAWVRAEEMAKYVKRRSYRKVLSALMKIK